MIGRLIVDLKREDGFSLVELLIVSALTVVVLVSVYNIFVSGLNDYEMVEQQNQAVRDGGRNIYVMGKYLRETEELKGPLELGDPGDYGLSTRVDADEDGEYEVLTYALDEASQELRLTYKDNDGSTYTQRYASFVRNKLENTPIFTYYDVNGAVISTPGQRASRTKAIQIQLIIDADTATPPRAVDVKTTVTLRNVQS